MNKLILLVGFMVVATPKPGQACMSEADMMMLRTNRALAVANHCENAIVQPGVSIGPIWINESAEDAVKIQANGIAFEIDGGKVVRVRHSAANACVQSGVFQPLRVITASSPLAPITGTTITRDAAGVHVAVSRI